MSKKINVVFIDNIHDSLLKFAVIIAKYRHQYVLVKHKQRDSLEFPGGKRIMNESILDCAKRELYEETGAKKFSLLPLSISGVVEEDKTTYCMLYKGEIFELSDLPESEIEKVVLLDEFPTSWTYPEIQPYLLNFYLNG